ncbi:MAG: hypothetical protein R6X02_04100 [Enhygromyxa sp.]
MSDTVHLSSHRPLRGLLSSFVGFSLSIASLPGCVVEDEPDRASLRSAANMILSETYSTESSPKAPLTVGSEALAPLQEQVQPFRADGRTTTTASDLYRADVIHVRGVDGEVRELVRIENGLRLQGVEGNLGIQWSSDFRQLAFHTPQGTYRLGLRGTLSERQRLAATLSILGLGGTSDPEAAMVVFAWPAVAIVGLIVVSWGVMCLTYTQMCHNNAARICSPNGVASVTVGCGGIKTNYEGGTKTSGGLEIGAFECSYTCNPPDDGDDDDGGDEGGFPGVPELPELFPDPDWEDNPCPPGQSAQPCQITETTTTTNNSGGVEEVTVETSTSFGYCCR